MTLDISCVDTTREWVSDLEDIILNGKPSSPRGQGTLELLAYQSIMNMNKPVIVMPTRKLGYKFMAAEAAWILSGDNRVETIAPFSAEISKFSDDGVTFFGAYGPKIVAQLDHVANTLAEDQDSRQALINIWRENPPKTKDVPCTVSVQWLIREGQLFCFDTMRSSDIWLGHPYDVFNFSALSAAIVIMLRERGVEVTLGPLILTAGSKHLYDRNLQSALKVVSEYKAHPDWYASDLRLDPEKFSDVKDLTNWLWEMAHKPEGILDSSGWR